MVILSLIMLRHNLSSFVSSVIVRYWVLLEGLQSSQNVQKQHILSGIIPKSQRRFPTKLEE